MHYDARVDRDIGLLTVDLTETCHTDSSPLVSQLFVHNAEFDVGANGFALAVAILVRNVCGELFSSTPTGIGLEYARAIGQVMPHLVSVTTTRGHDRRQSSAEYDVICAPARNDMSNWMAHDSVPLLKIDWSGDPVQTESRRSDGYRQGRYVTNAGLFADETSVCIALGLMHAGTTCRNLIVPMPPAKDDSLVRIATGLRTVGIVLHFV